MGEDRQEWQDGWRGKDRKDDGQNNVKDSTGKSLKCVTKKKKPVNVFKHFLC